MALLSSPQRLTRFLPSIFQLEDRSTPATINVTSLADTVVVDGAVTLREAIQSVNAGANVNADVTATGYGTADTITFTGPSGGTITLASNLDAITKAVAIIGPISTDPRTFNEPLVTVDGNNNTMFVIQASGVALRGLSIVDSADYGVRLGAGAASAVVSGNFIGLRTDGVTLEGNRTAGVFVGSGASNNTIGVASFSNTGVRNIIAGNGSGVILDGAGTSGNVVAGNGIGTDRSDSWNNVNPGNDIGVWVRNGASNNSIGVTNFENIISGNRLGVLITGAGTSGNSVIDNRIGTVNTVSNAVGVEVSGGASGNTIGGPIPSLGGSPGNEIFGNLQFGVRVRGAGTTGTVIAGNSISASALPNSAGVEVSAGAANTLIGGTATNVRNFIGGYRAGVLVDAQTSGVQVLGNSIQSNTGLGIDLSAGTTPDGVTANDLGDADVGGNGLQNFPVITSVTETKVTGVLNSTPNRTFRIEFFASFPPGRGGPGSADPSGFGEGPGFLGFITVTTDANGFASFTVTPPGLTIPPGLIGRYVTVTATDLTTNNTSEFSNAFLGLANAPVMPAITPPTTPSNNPPTTPIPVKFDALVPAGYTPIVRAGQLSPTAGKPQALDPKSVLVVGSGPGGPALIVVYNPDGSERWRIDAFPGFTGGVRVATSDINSDGYPDIVAAAGPGGGPNVKVYDGTTGKEVSSFYAYDPSFSGGVWVAAGDMNGDGFADIITGAGAGGAPHVRVFSGGFGLYTRVDQVEIASFYAYATSFGGGVTVAASDFNNDGLADIITGAGAGGAPHVKVLEATSLRQVNADGTIMDSALLASFYAYSPTFTGGVFVSGGADFNHDGWMDLVMGAGAGGGPHVKVISVIQVGLGASDGTVRDSALLGSFYAYDATFTGGVRVNVADMEQDGDSEVVVAPGSGIAPRVRVLRTDGQPAVGDILPTDPVFTNGVFVG